MRDQEATITRSEKNKTVEIVLNFKNGSTIIYNPESRSKFVYATDAPLFKNVVFSGGGAKGVVYPGVIAAFEEAKVKENFSFRQQLESVAGASIGAITAALFACGLSAQEFIDFTKNQNFRALLGESSTGLPVEKNGLPLLDMMRNKIAESLKANISLFKTFDNYQKLTSTQQDKIRKIVEEELHQRPPHITFSMLEVLHQLDPKTFKNLSVNAVCQETGETVVFNAHNTPDMEIAMACRASASLPLLLEPVPISAKYFKHGIDKQKYSDDQVLHFIDGGYRDNVPVSMFESDSSPRPNLETLVLVFDESEIAAQEHRRREETTDPNDTKNLQQSPFWEHRLSVKLWAGVNDIGQKLARNELVRRASKVNLEKPNTKIKEEGLKVIQENYSECCIAIGVGEVKTTDFDKARDDAEELIASAKEQTKKYLEGFGKRLGASKYSTYKNLEELVNDLPEEERRTFLGISEEDFEKFLGVDKKEFIKHLNIGIKKSMDFIALFADFFVKKIYCDNDSPIIWNYLEKQLAIIKKDSSHSDQEKFGFAKSLIDTLLVKFSSALEAAPQLEKYLNKMQVENYKNNKKSDLTVKNCFYMACQEVLLRLELTKSNILDSSSSWFNKKSMNDLQRHLEDIMLDDGFNELTEDEANKVVGKIISEDGMPIQQMLRSCSIYSTIRQSSIVADQREKSQVGDNGPLITTDFFL